VWPFETFADRRQHPFAEHRQVNLYDFDYRPFQSSGIELAGEPGDVLYWPSTYWHVGETEGGSVHISLHLTVDLHSEPRGEVVDLLHKLVEESLTEADWHDAYPIRSLRDSGPVQPPDRLMEALRALTQAMQGSIRESVNAQWLSRMSAQGFWTLASPSSDAASADIDALRTTLQADLRFPVYWIVTDDRVTMAAHGRVVQFPVRHWTKGLLAALSDRRPFLIADLAPISTGARDEITALATKLVAIGALHAKDRPCSTSTS
jgi:hypothetical protein